MNEREKGNIKVTCCSLVEITKDGYSSLVLLKGFLADYHQLWGALKVWAGVIPHIRGPDLVAFEVEVELWLQWWFTFARQEFKFGGSPDIETGNCLCGQSGN